MATVIYSMNVSLDGYVAAPDGSLEFSVVDEEIHRAFEAQEAMTAVAVYGRRLWHTMAAHWPTADQNPEASPVEVDYAHVWQALQKVVVSRTLTAIEGPNVRLVHDDPVTLVRSLQETTDGIISIAGPTVAAPVIEADLIDEYHPYIHPVLLGAGKRFLPDRFEMRRLELTETRRFGSGVIALRYQRQR